MVVVTDSFLLLDCGLVSNFYLKYRDIILIKGEKKNYT